MDSPRREGEHSLSGGSGGQGRKELEQSARAVRVALPYRRMWRRL